MIKPILYLRFVIFIMTIMLLTTCISNKAKLKTTYGEATKELISLVESNQEVKFLLIASIEKAKQTNSDRNTNPAQNLEAYYEFISWAETSMPWTFLKKDEYPNIFDNISQSLCYFYFLIDQPLPELRGMGYVNNSLQYAEPFASWLTKFTKLWGKFLDTEASWNETYYQMGLNDPNFGLQNGWYEDPSNWKTFNEFFKRHLANPNQRPIAVPMDNSIIVSSSDSEPQGVWAIDNHSNLVFPEGVVVKSATVTSIAKLIGENSKYKDSFANGTFTHSFLNVNDYHRYHFPIGGTVKEVRVIQGINPTGGAIWWDAKNDRYVFDPSAKTGWQTVETRGCIILETEDFGLVALLPIGMAAVGSVNFEEHIHLGTQVKKGDKLGYFAFGGSDFVMIFQSEVQFVLDAPKKEDGNSYKHLLMGEQLGYVIKKALK